MTGTAWKFGLLLSCVVGLACGSKGQTKADSPDGREQSAPPAPPSEEELPPPEPVAAPPGVVVRARVESPSALAQALSDAASSPLSVRQLLERFSPELERLFEEAIDPAAPIEALVALNPVTEREPFAAWSISARGTRPVLAALDDAQIEFREGPSGVFYFGFDGGPCALGRSRGKSRARVVCADREESLEALVGYMLRGLPDEKLSGAAAHLELTFEPLQAAYGAKVRQLRLLASVVARQLHQDNPTFDEAISEVVTGLTGELSDLAEDLERFDADLWIKERSFTVTARVSQKGQKSWSAAALGVLSRKQAVAPELFRKLPAEVSAATYGHSLPEAQTSGMADTLARLVQGSLEVEGVSAGRAKSLGHSLMELLFAERTVVLASGPLVLGSDGDESVLGPAYRLMGTTRDRKELISLLESVAGDVSSREIQKVIADKETTFQFKKRRKGLSGVKDSTVFEWALPKELPGGLDKAGALGAADTEDIQQLLGGGEGLLAVAPVGEFTWAVLGKTDDQLQEGFSALTGESVQRLGSDPKLADFVGTPAVGAAFFRLDWLLGLASSTMPAKDAKKMKDALRDLPHQGQVPVTYFLQATAAGRVESTVTIQIPPGFLTDAFGLALVAGAEL